MTNYHKMNFKNKKLFFEYNTSFSNYNAKLKFINIY